ncbi:cytochrome c biogenesis protein CcmG, thiol:disulfide interchange protein DsbE [Sphingomonas laterariae]|uniref:Cytochrome c biogenesis protein CcmG, thiol:disulfide interchange protein DsbE n=1 Tax=Edaphosphingomonas laterariae TaxID=861865 RepID=A0A239BQT4_9SPHN|nr:DsbE family thiol:disulfide interchange protein [Sphingomonas laterariae]SNS09761.1 cytochrome c biogenesis protein CcmG, thiol:disulfide interchange protein DsbE [Sphingomonas laterariae]
MKLRTVRLVLWAPLILFLIFVATFATGLIKPESKIIPSKMVGKPLPQFALPPGAPGITGLSSADFAQGEPRLLNVFASWCVPCAAEAPQLTQLAEAGVKIDAIAIRDRPEDVAGFLQRWGNPYQRIGSDTQSSVQIAMGSAGVPETFVVDGKGIIRHQHIGEIRPEDVPAILAAVKGAR